MASHPIYELRAELQGYSPSIWRRFQVMRNVTMARLGYILMTMFEMQASHLFRIEVPFNKHIHESMRQWSEEEYAEMYPELEKEYPIKENMTFELITEDTYFYRDIGEKVYEAADHRIKDIISHPGNTLMFVYDFGDNWHVLVTLERIFEDSELSGRLLPRVLEGEGFGIIEDCGGLDGLADLAESFRKKKGSTYEMYSEWLGSDDFDLESFDIEDMNFRLKKVPRIYADIYEYELEPTQRSMDILTRRYLKDK